MKSDRRQFLKSMGLGSAALGVADAIVSDAPKPALSPENMESGKEQCSFVGNFSDTYTIGPQVFSGDVRMERAWHTIS